MPSDSSDASLPDWVSDAARMPIAFAQVREDALLDLAMLEWLGRRDLRVMMIASGGCTAAALAASGRVQHLHLVDVNPAQLILTRMKLHLLSTASPRKRAELLGHAECPLEHRLAGLVNALDAIEAPPSALGPPESVAKTGPDYAGRYELLFSQLRSQTDRGADTWIRVFAIHDSGERAARVAPSTDLGRALDGAFDHVMALPNLEKLFSAQATRNSVEPFSRHFARRTRDAIAMPGASINPYLWQLLLGQFPPGVAYPWLGAPAPERMPQIVESAGPMDAALCGCGSSFDYIHLSNILDWLDPGEAYQILAHAYDALRPGGLTLVRQLNSMLDIPSLGERFEWLRAESGVLHGRDRSFFYRSLHLGRKR